ncbi:MAG: hypothetical protein KJS91_14105 [Planctomycetes bacterium]|nr:hypothetical protein [Planctomycetota bacterium]
MGTEKGLFDPQFRNETFAGYRILAPRLGINKGKSRRLIHGIGYGFPESEKHTFADSSVDGVSHAAKDFNRTYPVALIECVACLDPFALFKVRLKALG